MATLLETSSFGYENFYVGYLTADITASSTDIFIDTPPTSTEGTLIIDPDSTTGREIIYYTSRSATKVTIPSVANGRGYDNTTASAHVTGTKVIMAPIADWFNSLRSLFTTTPQGWTSVGYTPSAVVANGNRSYTCTFSSVDLTATLSAGMRLKTTRTVAAPTQCTSLNGTNQYYSKTSPAGMTFTNTMTASAWIKPSSYAKGGIIGRGTGTNVDGWDFNLNSSGQVQVTFWGAGAVWRSYNTYQSVSLNKWTHVAFSLTAGTNTITMYLDGVVVPSTSGASGSPPSAIINSGTLYVGALQGATNFFSGKIAQAAVYSTVLTTATILATISQGLAGTETSLISAYSFNNSINDLNTTNANNLTANGSAVATNADSPFGGQADGTISSTLDYAIITKTAFSTNTTVTVQVPEGCTIPTTGGVSAVSYATVKAPYGMPAQRGKWTLETRFPTNTSISTTNATWNSGLTNGSTAVQMPVGEWRAEYSATFYSDNGGSALIQHATSLSTSNNGESDNYWSDYQVAGYNYTSNSYYSSSHQKAGNLSLSTATTYYLVVWGKSTGGGLGNAKLGGGVDFACPSVVRAELAYL